MHNIWMLKWHTYAYLGVTILRACWTAWTARSPVLTGVGLLHVRVRSCVPPPQVTVHVPQLPHEAQLPSTKSLIVENISMENIVLEIWHLQILRNMNTEDMILHLLGQCCVLQACDDPLLPGHAAPPYCGAGFVHVRDRVCEPPPHVTVQIPQDPQLAQTPSTWNVFNYLSCM